VALVIFGFIGCAAAILWAGTRLTIYADVIAERTRLGRVWAGMVLLAVATSLPELFNSTSAVVQNLPNIAAGDVAGSNILNLAILGIVGVFSRSRTRLHGLSRFHVRSAWFIIVMSVLAAGSIMLGPRLPALGWISPVTPLILLLYFWAVRKAGTVAETASLRPVTTRISLRTAVIRYILFALAVVTAAVLLPSLASHVATSTGLGNTFVGTIMVAFATSLPELVTATAAVRIRAPEMAVGGLIGSNLFNLGILGIGDIVYWRGSLFAAVQSTHTVPLSSGLLLAGLFIIILKVPPGRRFLRITWFGWAAIAVYLANALFLYAAR